MSNKHLAEKIYYDVLCTNLQQVSAPPPTLSFIETRSIPFVWSPEDYYMSIVRFTVDTPSLPVFVPEIQPNQPDRDLTIYSITLQYTANNGTTYTQQTFVRYTPQSSYPAVPQPPSQTTNGLQNNATEYYYIYNYQYWIYLINQTFIKCYTDLAQKVSIGLNTDQNLLPSQYPPVLAFDTGSSIAILYCDVAGYSTKLPASNPINIFFNANLYALFSSFPVYIQNLGLTNQGRDALIQTDTFGGSNLLPYPPTSDPPDFTAIAVYQEFSTVSLWSPVSSIVFCSNSLPIVPNQLSAPLVFVNGLGYNLGGNNANLANIVTDLVADQYKPNIIYNPTAQYRLIELVGTSPIYTLDISCFWKNRIGELVPFRLSAGCTATIKFLFTRKDTES
jgi:hypothetical protein